ASSNHAADWYEHALIHARHREAVTPADLPLSDNFYGWSKAAYELLGFVYACASLGRKLEVVLLRVGAPRDGPAGRAVPGTLRDGARQRQARPWGSPLAARPAPARPLRAGDSGHPERARRAVAGGLRDQREHPRLLVAGERASCPRIRAAGRQRDSLRR